MGDPFRSAAKKRCYVDKGIHRCENCTMLTYNGSSLKNATKMFEKYGEIFTVERTRKKKGKPITKFYGFELDHVHPVVDPETGDKGWDLYVPRMFPDTAEGYLGLCMFCHGIKTKMENIERGKDKGDWDSFFDSFCDEELTGTSNPAIMNLMKVDILEQAKKTLGEERYNEIVEKVKGV